MIVDTHLLMSQILYKYLSSQTSFKLNRIAFAYGNIKPDFFDKEIKCSHTLDESLYSVNKFSEELMRRNISNKDFSRGLGVICHFVCDYFCLYHREGNEKKGVVEHLFYELFLHVKLLTLIFKAKLNLNNLEMFENSVQDIVMKQQKKYNLEPKSLTRDINHALFASLQTLKFIVYSSQLYFEKNEVSIPEEYEISLFKGGRL